MTDSSLSGPKRAGRTVPAAADRPPTPPVLHPRRARVGDPAIAYHGASNGVADTSHGPVRAHLARIEKLLRTVERQTYQRMSTVFDDWVELTNIMLAQLPAHLREAVETGQLSDWPAETPPERIAAFMRIKERYGAKAPEAFAGFSHATAAFLDATHDSWFDWMGQLYMTLELGGRGIGDYYTPWAVAFLMAQMQDVPSLLAARLKAALSHEDNVLGMVVGVTGLLFQAGPTGEAPAVPDAHLDDYLARWVIPAVTPYFEPITVYDPACGSGVMLLASAATVPLWARRYGLVQYFGMDISHIAVQMCQAQTQAYGLNGYEATMVQAISDAGWDKFRQRLQAAHAHQEALAAVAGPDPEPSAVAVVPRAVTGHIATPTLRRRALAQGTPTIDLRAPTPEETRRILAGRPPTGQARPQAAE